MRYLFVFWSQADASARAALKRATEANDLQSQACHRSVTRWQQRSLSIFVEFGFSSLISLNIIGWHIMKYHEIYMKYMKYLYHDHEISSGSCVNGTLKIVAWQAAAQLLLAGLAAGTHSSIEAGKILRRVLARSCTLN